MNITKEGEGLTAVLKVNISPEDYASRVESALKEQRKKTKLDGFRPGTVPMGMVKKLYGKYILIDEVNSLLSDSLQNYIRDNTLRLLGEPLPNTELQKEIDWDSSNDFEFVFDIALAPEVSVSLSKKNKAVFYKIIADDEMIQNQIDSFASRFGTQETVDSIEGMELVRGHISQVIDENPHAKENVSLLLSKVATEDGLSVFKTAKVDDVITFNPLKTFENETEVAALLGIEKENRELLKADYTFQINEILRFKKAEINQDLFDKVFGEGVVSSEEEMRQKLKEDAEKQLTINSDYKFFYDFKESFVKSQKIELPEEFLKRWLLETNKDNDKITPEQIESDFSYFLDDLRWQLLSGTIMKDNDITVTQDDIKQGAKEFTRMQFAQFGVLNPAEEDLEKWSVEILKNREEANKIYETELQNKLVAYLKNTIKLDEKEVTLEEFNKIIEQK